MRNLSANLNTVVEDEHDPITLLEWTGRYRPWLTPNTKFDLDSHRYLRGVYGCEAREKAIMKSGQSGASEFCISYTLWSCDERRMDVLYLLPTRSDISDFSQMRIGPAMDASEYLQEIIKDVDRVHLKRIRSSNLILRGSQVKEGKSAGERRGASQLKSVPADLVIYDEFDEMPIGVEALAQKRLGHSLHKESLFVSTPTYPGLGIHSKWNLSDQRLWFLRCDACGHRGALTIANVVIEFDDLERPLAWHGKEDGRAFCACAKCGSELDRLAEGEWVPTYPDREMAGFSFNKLVTAQNNPLDVVKNLHTVDETKRQEAFNQDLALPYRPRGGGLTEDILDACRREYGHGPIPTERPVMGVDVGNVLTVVIRGQQSRTDGSRAQLYAGEVLNFEDVIRLIRLYRVSVCVVDALPETRAARNFQTEVGQNIVWLCYYTGGTTGKKTIEDDAWNFKEYEVTVDRTRTLDETFSRFTEGINTLPGHARGIENYYPQLLAPVRIQRKRPDGTTVAIYVDVGADHFSHAENYATVASSQSKRGGEGMMI